MADESANCIFCKIVRGEIPSTRVCETDTALAMMDIQPINPGHVLVIPKSHAAYLADLDPELGGEIFQLGMQIGAGLRSSGVRCDGVNLYLADGKVAGQEVFHVHLHVIPRFEDDGFGLRYGPNYGEHPAREELARIAGSIKDAMTRS
ncbi:MAG TPA: HIT family protein [Candidatus Binataceae bacterium]|nr:HIT family protein [Candidatus Binataceae bacterium]